MAGRARPAAVRLGAGPGLAHDCSDSDVDEPQSPLGFTRSNSGAEMCGIKSDVKRQMQEMRKLSDKRRRSSGEGAATAGGMEVERQRSSFGSRTLLVIVVGVWTAIFLVVVLGRARAASTRAGAAGGEGEL